MKYIILTLVFTLSLMAGVVKSPIVSVDAQNDIATIKIDYIDVGVNGFVVHSIAKNHTAILKNIVVSDYNKETKVATLKMSPYDALRNNALPSGRWSIEVGDMALLAFGYSRGILIAPNDEVYHRITRSMKGLQWIHPDIFATILSFNGHPTPLREDFNKLSIAVSVGLVFIYIEDRLYTVDSKSFKILNITEAKLKQNGVKLPFYSRVEEIDANWFGSGSNELESYEPYYYELLLEANPKNRELKKIVDDFNIKASND